MKKINKIEIYWKRGLSEDWDGWHFKTRSWSSGPYESLDAVLTELARRAPNKINLKPVYDNDV